MRSQAERSGDPRDPAAGDPPPPAPGSGGDGAPLPEPDPGARPIASLDRILNCIADPIFVKDDRHRLVLVNDAECAFAGRTRAELLGRPDDRILAPEQVDVFWRQDDQVIATGEESVSEEEIADAQGVLRTVITRKTRFVDDAGHRFVVGVIRDITARKRAEERLVVLAAAVEQSADDIVVTDRDGGVRYVNSAFTRTTGYAPAEAEGRSIFELLGGVGGDPVHEEIQRALRAGGSWQGRIRSRAKDGRALLLDTSIAPIRDAAGHAVGYVSARRDVTRQAEMEERLVQTEKLEAIGALAGGIAHDFNNLLTVILGCLGKVVGGLGADSPLRRSADQAHAAAQRCAALTRQLLALGRRSPVRPEPLDLNACLTRMTDLVGHALRSDITLVCDLGRDLGRVSADVGQVEQVLLNLALNARDAMPEGGTLRLTTANADVPGSRGNGSGRVAPGRYVVLAVSDTGVGIEPHIRERIFEPFFTTKAQGQGTGLGLATVYAIVRQSGGEIEVESERGRGSTFRVYLPRLAEEPAAETMPRPTRARSGAPVRILVVDDEAAIRELARDILETAGFGVVEAADGREGLRMADGDGAAIALVLTDVVMPELDGPDMVDRIRTRRPGARVMYMSGYTGLASDRLNLTSPGTVFLQKPFTPKDLLAGVEQALAA